MAKTPSAQILCNTAALSRAADAILARGETLTKNAILNAMAAAIAGDGHDWGFLKNAPNGLAMQPGLNLPSAPTTDADESLAGRQAWVLHYDERDDWGKAPMLFPSKAAALKQVAEDHNWWRHADHPFETVMSSLSDHGEYTFSQEDDLMDDTSPYQIWLQPVTIGAEVAASQEDPVDDAEALDAACPIVILTDCPVNPWRDQDLDWEMLFEDSDTFQKECAEHDVDLSDVAGDIHLARDCTLTARIRPEADFRKHIIEVDPQGETEWKVHAHELEPNQDYLDYLKDSRNAPRWVKDWVGPFTIKLDITPPQKAV